MADQGGTAKGQPASIRRHEQLTAQLAALYDELGRTADALARSCELSAEVHDRLPSDLLSSPDHAERERMLADAEHAAAAAYRAHQVPPDGVRAAIIRAGKTGGTDSDDREQE